MIGKPCVVYILFENALCFHYKELLYDLFADDL